MRYIHSAAAKWSRWPRHHGHMITSVTPPARLIIYRYRGGEQTGTRYAKKNKQTNQKSAGGGKEALLVCLT